jgi:hypothetical protein
MLRQVPSKAVVSTFIRSQVLLGSLAEILPTTGAVFDPVRPQQPRRCRSCRAQDARPQLGKEHNRLPCLKSSLMRHFHALRRILKIRSHQRKV